MNLDETREWLEILYADTPGFINICSTGNFAGQCFRASETDAALKYVQSLDEAGKEGIYLRVTTLRQAPEPGKRGGDNLSLCLPGLWADVDIEGPGHKHQGPLRLPSSIDEAMQIVAQSGLPEPSHWIHSGGGLYPWWLLREPAIIDDLEDAKSLTQGWQAILGASAAKLGYHYGTEVGDLSRVLRLPGTTNRKAGMQRPCTALREHAWAGRVYELPELYEALTANAPPPPVPSRIELKIQAQTPASGIQPGDDFNRRISWHDLLLPLGWQFIRKTGYGWVVRRPGKTSGEGSATLWDSTGNLHIFSTEAPHPLRAGQHYSKWAFYTHMEHSGDFRASAKDLAQKGFGTPIERTAGSNLLLDSAETVGMVPAQMAAPVTAISDTEAVDTASLVNLDSLGLPRYPDEALTAKAWTQVGAARMWSAINQKYLAYLGDQKQWRQWCGDAWCADDLGRQKNSAIEFTERLYGYAKTQEDLDPLAHKGMAAEAKKLCNNNAINGMLALASTDPRIATVSAAFDKDPSLLTMRDGTLNLNTLQLKPHDPGDMLTRRINASYGSDAGAGRWSQFMEQVLPDKDVRQYLQRAAGYMLTGTLDERVMFLVHGPSGTGKTQFLEALRGVLGDFAGVAPASAFQPRQAGYSGPTEGLHKLMGKRFVLQSELDSGSKINESLVKSIVGADTQTTRPLYGAPIDWQPEYTVFMATNYLPRISSSDNAIWNRVKPVKFEQVFIDDSGQALDPSSRNLGRKMAEECADEIFAWIIEGLKAYREQGLNEPQQIRDWLSAYRDDVDVVRQFLTEGQEDGTLAAEEGAQVLLRELHRVFITWSQLNNSIPLGAKTFNERMRSAGWASARQSKGMFWQGLRVAGWLGEAQQPVYHRRA